MSTPIRISAKHLGAIALSDFCPRCFWVQMRCEHKLPFQIFPGIFSSIDSYSKKVTAAWFRRHGRLPSWFDGFGRLGSPVAIPHGARFQVLDQETNVLLTGVPDEILRHPKRGLWIGDYKCARFTDTQDKLAPMYEVQLNGYAYIAPRVNLGEVYGVGLLYYEPVTDLSDADLCGLVKPDCFCMRFSPKVRKVPLRPEGIRPLLRQVRRIVDLSTSPDGRLSCPNCELLDILVRSVRGHRLGSAR